MNQLAVKLALTFSLSASALLAAPQGAAEARLLAQGWLRVASCAPLHERLPAEPGEVEPIAVGGQTVGYAFALQPCGFIVTSADDTVEPIIAFSRTGGGPVADGSPLAELLRSDLPRRLAAEAAAPRGLRSLELPEATRKWALFTAAADDAADLSALSNNGLSAAPADLRVAPLVGSRWNQSTVSGLTCYNYYTPNNYVCGCVGTAWGQIMRYHQYPTNGIGQRTRTVLVDGLSRSVATRGGNGTGGPYAWSSMPLLPDATLTVAQRQAIGALTSDAVVAASTNSVGLLSQYTASGTSAYMPPVVMTGIFGYASTLRFDGTVNRTNAINANLDAGYPVNVSLPSHSVVCDGYGFQSGTAYHHLNMGWSGQDDAWYALGNVVAGGYTFTGIEYIYGNIFPGLKGEIVSGRVLSASGTPLANATVTLAPGGRTDSTDGAGVYAFAGVASAASVTLTALKAGYSFGSKNVTLGTSVDQTTTCGNRAGNDFSGTLSGSYRLVSGRLVNAASNGIANLAVTFSNGGGSTLTDGSGNYSQALPLGWSGTVTPAATGGDYFAPAAYAVANLQAGSAGLDFRGTLMRFVKANATGANTGTSWHDAYTNLVNALTSTPFDQEIWVASGTYKPVAFSRDNAFFFNPGQIAYGGFSGTETRREQRDWRSNPTVLSGDIGILNTVTDNCYTVVRGAAGARVDGFTITGGNASYAVSGLSTYDELARGIGGGVFIWGDPTTEQASFVVDHCIVMGNRANNDEGGPGQGSGGGIFSSIVRNSLLHNNVAQVGSAGSKAILENCTVVSNTASTYMAVDRGAVTNCIVYYNTGGEWYLKDLYWDRDNTGFTCTSVAASLSRGINNTASAPLFVNAAAGNFMIATNSPCKNAGVALPWMAGAQDLFGDSRSSGAAPDMGAYELQATHPSYEQRPESTLRSGSAFTVSVQTRYGWSYRLQWRASLVSGSWQNVSGASAAGDGTVKTLTDTAATAGQRFYRVYAQ